jgi:hypothetical protein
VKPHRFHRAADVEYAEAAAYYADISAQLGGRFYEEIERLIAEIRAHPAQFRALEPPARRHFSAVFPYAVIYVELHDIIWILAVMHLKREAGCWKERL